LRLRDYLSLIAVAVLVGALVKVGSAEDEAAGPAGTPFVRPVVYDAPISFHAGRFRTWKTRGVRVFLAEDGFTMAFLDRKLSAGRGVVWLHEAESFSTRTNRLEVYASDQVRVVRGSTEVVARKLFFQVRNSRKLAFDDADHRAEAVQPSLDHPLYTAATAERTAELLREEARGLERRGQIGVFKPTPDEVAAAAARAARMMEEVPAEPVDGVPVPKLAVPAPAPGEPEVTVVGPPEAFDPEGLKEPELEIAPPSGLAPVISALGYPGRTFNIETVVEGERTVYIVTGGADIQLAGAAIPGGSVEFTAEDMVLWVNLEKLAETNDLSASDAALYAEGHVTIYFEDRIFRASRVFYDLTDSRAIIFDARISTVIEREVRRRGTVRTPLFFRANLVRQLSVGRLVAYDAIVTNCEFAEPHVFLRTEKLNVDKTRAGTQVTGHNVTFRVNDVPLLWWPYFTWNLDDDIILKRLRYKSTSDFGTTVMTSWDLFDSGLFNWITFNDGQYAIGDLVDAAFSVDFYGDRGLGLGLEAEYDVAAGTIADWWDWPTYGTLATYYIQDRESDRDEDIFGFPLDKEHRGRVHWMQRTWLTPDTNLDFEFTWLSDEAFLDTFFERDEREEKVQENLAYLKHQQENWALWVLGKFRVNDFRDVTELLPQVGLNVIGRSLFWDYATFFSASQAAWIRNMPPDGMGLDSHSAFRTDSVYELDVPLALGPVKFVPYTGVRLSSFDDTPGGDSLRRIGGEFGVRGSTRFHRTFDVTSRLLDVDGLRHVVVPDFDYRNVFAVSRDPDEFYPFDEVEHYDSFEVFRLGIRQRLQTHRRRKTLLGASGPRSMNMMLFDVEIDYFPEPDRDNYGDAFGTLDYNYVWNITDPVSLFADGEIEVNDGWQTEIANVGVRVNRSPNFTFFVGNRYIRAARSTALTCGADYRINPKWRVRPFLQYDFERNTMLQERIILERTFHKWVLELVASYDGSDEDRVLGFYIVPIGSPQKMWVESQSAHSLFSSRGLFW